MVTLYLAVVWTFSVLCCAKMCKKFCRNCSDVVCTELRTSSVPPGTICGGKISLFSKKKTLTRTHAAMKEAYGEQTLARGTIFRWHQQFTQGRASASPKPKSGRQGMASTETKVNTISTMLADDDFLSQWQIAHVGILQTTVKKINFSLFFPVISVGVYAYTITWNVRTCVLFAL